MPRIGIRIPGAQLDNDQRPFIESLELAADTGYQAVEICPEDFDAIRTGILDHNITGRLNEILSGYPFDISVHVPLALNLMNREFPELHRQVFKCCLEFASGIGSKILVFHPGRYTDNIEFARYGKRRFNSHEKKALIEHEINIIRQEALDFPEVTIAIENHRPYVEHSPYSYGEFPGEIAAVVMAINLPNVGMMIDTGHLNLSASYHGFDAVSSVLESGLELAHLHINDNNGIPTYYTEKDKKGQLPFGRGDEHVPPGYGMFDFRKFFNAIPKFDGCAVIELTNHWFYPNKIRESYHYLSEIIKKEV